MSSLSGPFMLVNHCGGHTHFLTSPHHMLRYGICWWQYCIYHAIVFLPWSLNWKSMPCLDGIRNLIGVRDETLILGCVVSNHIPTALAFSVCWSCFNGIAEAGCSFGRFNPRTEELQNEWPLNRDSLLILSPCHLDDMVNKWSLKNFFFMSSCWLYGLKY